MSARKYSDTDYTEGRHLKMNLEKRMLHVSAVYLHAPLFYPPSSQVPAESSRVVMRCEHRAEARAVGRPVRLRAVRPREGLAELVHRIRRTGFGHL